MKKIDPEFVSLSSIYELLDKEKKDIPLIEEKIINH